MKSDSDELRILLRKIFQPKVKWGDNQMQCYEELKSYVSNNIVQYINGNWEKDKYNIFTNLKGQLWYQNNYKTVNIILSDLLSRMKIIKIDSLNREETKLLILEIDFDNFDLNVNYYNQTGQILSLLIYLTKKEKDNIIIDQFKLNGVLINPSKSKEKKKSILEKQSKKNYLAYNITSSLAKIPSDIQEKMVIPELEDLNDILDINSEMISADLLMRFFLEIILYYDSTETIGNIKLCPNGKQTINQIMSSNL